MQFDRGSMLDGSMVPQRTVKLILPGSHLPQTFNLFRSSNNMIAGEPKENANPVVREVQRRLPGKKKRLGWSDVERLNIVYASEDGEGFEEKDDSLILSPLNGWNTTSTASERSIFLALTEAAKTSDGDGVGLLRNAGFVLPSSTEFSSPPPALRQPSFFPATISRKDPNDESPTVSRDKIDAEEVFDIIRKIQDPEHPLTLEQLHVVNLDHVEVHDDIGQSSSVASSSEPHDRETALSSVDVRFT